MNALSTDIEMDRMELRKVVFGQQDVKGLALNKWLSKET